MLLQTKLFYICETLSTCSTDTRFDVLLYGVEQLKCLCAAWKEFFVPDVLAGLRVPDPSGDAELYHAWKDLADFEDIIDMTNAMCHDVMARYRAGDDNGVNRRFSVLVHILNTYVRPAMLQREYMLPGSAKLLLLSPSHKIMRDLVFVSVSDELNGAPGIFTTKEKCVVDAYLRTLRNAPSLVTASGVAQGDPARWDYLSLSEYLSDADVALSPLDRAMIDESWTTLAICRALLEQWKQHLSKH